MSNNAELLLKCANEVGVPMDETEALLQSLTPEQIEALAEQIAPEISAPDDYAEPSDALAEALADQLAAEEVQYDPTEKAASEDNFLARQVYVSEFLKCAFAHGFDQREALAVYLDKRANDEKKEVTTLVHVPDKPSKAKRVDDWLKSKTKGKLGLKGTVGIAGGLAAAAPAAAAASGGKEKKASEVFSPEELQYLHAWAGSSASHLKTAAEQQLMGKVQHFLAGNI